MPHRGSVPLKEAVSSLIYALEQRDPFGVGHANRVANYSLAIARRLNFPIEQQAIIQYASLLHDVGKIGMPDFVMQKNAKFSEDEYAIMREHPQIGAMIVGHINLLKTIQPVIMQHHEWVNGQGYPRRLKGEEICTEAKIISVTEAFDEMTTEKPYRNAVAPTEALSRLEERANEQFDGYYVKVFCQIVRDTHHV